MLLKKSTIALCSSGSLPTTFSSFPAHASSITSSSSNPATTPSSPSSPSTSKRPRCNSSSSSNQTNILSTATWRGSRCSYATLPDDSPHSPHHEPPAWPTTPHPTPYDIFAQARTAPYSKQTFYRLVKLYHPDRHPHAALPLLSRDTKLDRYRLVVAANAILSDPVRRRAYDLHGAGWATAADPPLSHTAFRAADRAWRREARSPAGNATWEDWEQWRRAHDDGAEKQNPLYMSNGLFVGALALFVVVGSWGQATRAGNHSVHLLEMRESSSQNISEEMWRRRSEKAVLGREERIETFLRQREGWNHGPSEDHVPKD